MTDELTNPSIFDGSEELLAKVTVDIPRKEFTMLSNKGTMKTVTCDDGDQFLRVLDLFRDTVKFDDVVYL